MFDPIMTGCSEYLMAGQLLALLVDRLGETRGGPPDMAVVHPGEMVPDYGCGLSTVRVVSVDVATPAVSHCTVDEHRIVLEMKMVRCYATPQDNGMPALGVLDSAVRDVADDARAMRTAIVDLRELSGLKILAGQWRPSGPRGGIHGGTMQAIVHAELGDLTPDIVGMVPGDPRA